MLKFYQCEKCKKVIITKEDCKLDGWKELVACSTDAAKEKHVPVVIKEGKKVKVDVGSVAHPMTAEHLIEWIALETEKGYQVQYLTAGVAPVCNFEVADDDKATRVYAYCNLHGLWAD